MDIAPLIVKDNGGHVSETGHKRVKIWCEAMPTRAFTNFLDAVTHGIEGLELVLKSERTDARYELVFVSGIRNMHKVAEQFILEVNQRLRMQPYELIEKFIHDDNEDQGHITHDVPTVDMTY